MVGDWREQLLILLHQKREEPGSLGEDDLPHPLEEVVALVVIVEVDTRQEEDIREKSERSTRLIFLHEARVSSGSDLVVIAA